jgi:hypothetical protein
MPNFPGEISTSGEHQGAGRDARSARSAGEQQDLARRVGTSGRWSAGAMEHAGDVVGVGDDLEDAHAAAALAADRELPLALR